MISTMDSHFWWPWTAFWILLGGPSKKIFSEKTLKMVDESVGSQTSIFSKNNQYILVSGTHKTYHCLWMVNPKYSSILCFKTSKVMDIWVPWLDFVILFCLFSVSLSLSLSLHLSICLSIYLPIYQSIHLSIYLSIPLSTHTYHYMYIYIYLKTSVQCEPDWQYKNNFELEYVYIN